MTCIEAAAKARYDESVLKALEKIADGIEKQNTILSQIATAYERYKKFEQTKYELVNKPKPPIDEIIFDSTQDAERAFIAVYNCAKKYGLVSLSEYIELCNIKDQPFEAIAKNRYKGWSFEDVKNAKICEHPIAHQPTIQFPCKPRDLNTIMANGLWRV